MRLFLSLIIFTCLLGIEATYDAECYQEALKDCNYTNYWQQHRCTEAVATLHPTGVILLGVYSKLETSYGKTHVPDRADG